GSPASSRPPRPGCRAGRWPASSSGAGRSRSRPRTAGRPGGWWCPGRSPAHVPRPGLEHLQHPVGDQVSAGDVHRRERRRDEQQHVAQRAVDRRGEQHDADQDDAVDGVGPGHQRRVQRRRHLADHLEADQQAEYEHRDVGEQHRAHAGSPFRSSRTAGCTTSPSWVTRTPAVISSAGSNTIRPSATRWDSSATTLRAYAVEAARGTAAARLPAPTTVTPAPVTRVRSGAEPTTLPPRSLAARSTTTEPGRIAASASAVTSTGGVRPGTCAVVITTSNRATAAAITSCWPAASSAVSSRAYPPSPVASVPRSSTLAPVEAMSARAAWRTS